MDAADAHALMAVLHAEWPKGDWIITDGTDEGDLTVRGAMFAMEFETFTPADGAEAIQRLRSRIPYRDGPQTADLRATLREVAQERELRERTETKALPSGEEVVWGDEAAAIIQRYFESVGDPAEARLKRAGASGDKEAKIEAGRLLAQKQIAAAPTRPEEMTLEVRPERTVNPVTACGVRWGTPMVKEPGTNRYVCPNCGRDEKEGCA